MLKKYSRVCNFCGNGTAAVAAASRAVQSILTEFGLNPLKFFEGRNQKKKILSQTKWKTRINKALNRVGKKLGNCTEKFRIFLIRKSAWFICLFWCRMCQRFLNTKISVYNFLSLQNHRKQNFILFFFYLRSKIDEKNFFNLFRLHEQG